MWKVLLASLRIGKVPKFNLSCKCIQLLIQFKKPSLFYFDFKEHPHISFDVFLNKFEKMLIDQICSYKDQWWSNSDACFDQITSVLFRFYDKNLFEHSLARSLNNAYKHSHTSTYSINGKPVEFDNLLQRYKNREYKQTILIDSFR